MNITDFLPAGSLNSEPFIFIFLLSSILYYYLKTKYSQLILVFLLSMFFLFAINNYTYGVVIAFLGFVIFNYIFYLYVFKSKVILFLAIIFNISILFFSKYFIFLLEVLNIQNDYKNLVSFFLFAGVSFFVFSMIATLVEQFKKKNKPADFLVFSVYCLFFPKIVMGPIISLSTFASQVKYKKPSEERTKLAVFLFMFGYAQKTLADFLFLYPNLVFSTPNGYAGSVHIVSIFAYSAQLYLDFAGYSLMAVAMALFFGYYLPQNFNRPYLSFSITDFWQRWHITLSLWLKNHIYIPLGGSQRGIIRFYMALFLTFVASGVWHGVGFNYLLWGIWHAIGIMIHKSWQKLGFSMPKILGWFLTIIFVSIGWILFIYNSLQDINSVIFNIINNFDISILPSVFYSNIEWSICFFGAWFLILSSNRFVQNAKRIIFNLPWALQILLIVIVFYANIYVKTVVVAPFIYESF